VYVELVCAYGSRVACLRPWSSVCIHCPARLFSCNDQPSPYYVISWK